jgi:hypothetical protein
MSCYPDSASHAGRQSTPDLFVNALLGCVDVSEEFVRKGCRPRSALDPDSAKRQLLRVKNANLEDAQKYFSILMTDAVEPGRNFIYANALAVKVDA